MNTMKKSGILFVVVMMCSLSMAFASGASESSGEGIELSILSHQVRTEVGEGGFVTGFFSALDEYIEDNPEIAIAHEGLDQTAYQTKITSLGAANDMPDIFMLKGSWVNTFVDNGWVVDISAELNADPEWKNGYIQGGFDAVTKNGKIYGIPQESMTTSLVFYNEDMWREIGYDTFPATWEELQNAVEKFKAKGIDTFAMGNRANWPAESCWLSTLGDRLTGTDWTNKIISNDPGVKFTDPEFVRSLEVFQELAEQGAFNPDINSINELEARTYYFNKKAASIVEGSWLISIIDSTAPEDVKSATKLAVLPEIKEGAGGANTASGGPAWFLAISNSVTGEEREAAIELLKYLTGPKQANVTASSGGITAWANPDYDKAKVIPLQQEYNSFIQNVRAVPIYDAAMEASVIETMNVGLQSLLIGEKSPATLAEEIQREQDRIQ